MRFLRVMSALIVTAALLTGMTACGSSDVAARVNGEEISRADLDAQVARLSEQYPGMFDGEDGEQRLLEFKRTILDSMIDSILVRQAAEERGIEVTDEEITEQVEALQAQIADFDTQLADAGMTMEDLRDQFRDQLSAQRLIEEISGEEGISEDQIAEYYNTNISRFTDAAQSHAAHILIALEEQAKAEDVLAEVRAGGDFAELAETHSIDPGSAANGGDLGWAEPSRYVPEFSAALGELEPGEVSDLVESEFGWHIIKMVESREETVQPLADVSAIIEQMIAQERTTDTFQSFLAELREAAEIEILVSELENVVVPEQPEQ